ncbi:S8 family serine peptidase [Flavobacterium stagni]|uniref:T9SS type A sorting domain-containing protein n=1 Tax=Flavobacterium stagni TaxID=2506421 RepID=A0A4Q1KD28_9FLAO|nr:S8 family serine peptidase [Flavobacterium stagni]RXR23262.1 T9SS type A sorting domain-containing protein [Flavobacterium stagni]
MRKIIFIFLFIVQWSSAQEDARIYFTDKPNAQAYLDNPLSMLTQRALDRRVAQNISLSLNDVPVETAYIDAVSNANGIEYKAQSKWMNCVHVRGSVQDIQALTALAFVDHIEFANPTLNSKASQPSQPLSTSKTNEVQVSYNYGNATTQVQMLNTHLLHQADFTGSGKIIAVLDSGFLGVDTAAPFQRLFTQNLILGGYNYVSQNTNVYDLHQHGTMVLSSMGGFVDGQLVGTAPNAQYYLYVTEDVSQENPVEESYWVQAAEEADRLGADIITSSLGYFQYENTNYSYTYSQMTGDSAFASKGVNVAFSKGMVVVISAGNSGNTTEPHVGVPAEATHALAVGAVDAAEVKAGFSSIGPSFDGRIKPDVMALGVSAAVSNPQGNLVYVNGTSLSCPILSGSIACLWAAVPQLTNQQVVDMVKQSADRYTAPNNQYGYGIPDLNVALTNALGNTAFTPTNFQVYPNPVAHEFSIVGIQNPGTIQLINTLGQVVLTQKINTSTTAIEVGELPSGIYCYQIIQNQQVITGKIIKK